MHRSALLFRTGGTDMTPMTGPGRRPRLHTLCLIKRHSNECLYDKASALITRDHPRRSPRCLCPRKTEPKDRGNHRRQHESRCVRMAHPL